MCFVKTHAFYRGSSIVVRAARTKNNKNNKNNKNTQERRRTGAKDKEHSNGRHTEKKWR
jgi:hypothetical protein